MSKTLMILEVSQKQSYIFSSKQLKENALRSDEIAYVTSPTFFQESAKELYRDEFLVFAGGGHTILCFDDRETATAFARKVTKTALTAFPGMELFVKQLPYDESLSPGENLNALTRAAEEKKSLRRSVFSKTTFGVEKLDPSSHMPVTVGAAPVGRSVSVMDAPLGWAYPTKIEDLTGKDNFIAVVHIDGNAMGKRVEAYYGKLKDWKEFCAGAQRFSRGIQADFEAAFRDTVDVLLKQTEVLERLGVRRPALPLRPVILAGDDVCFVTAGSIGLECARVFLEKLSERINPADEKGYSACAGVALVHAKYPFHQAYELAEALCSNAKKFGVSIDPDGRVSAMDWHIEFGQLKGSLDETRRDLKTEDGNQMELRPVTAVVPDGIDAEDKTGGVRTYPFFREMCLAMRGEYGRTARGKIKDLRTAFKQGVGESKFFFGSREIDDLLYHSFGAKYRTQEEREAEFRRVLFGGGGERFDKEPFRTIDGTTRCLFFDAIELIDHCEFFDEEGKE